MSNILARFDIKEKPFKEVSYQASSQQVLRHCSTDDYIKSITVSVRDENVNLFDFGGNINLNKSFSERQEVAWPFQPIMCLHTSKVYSKVYCKVYYNQDF